MTWMAVFLQGNIPLENHDVSWGINCFKGKKTPSNGNQVSGRRC
jgi:hypothetical protein